MKINRIFFTTLLIFSIACSSISFATELVPNVSGEGNISGEISGDILPDISGDVSGDFEENISGDISGDFEENISGDVSGDIDDNVLESQALNSSFLIKEKSKSSLNLSNP